MKNSTNSKKKQVIWFILGILAANTGLLAPIHELGHIIGGALVGVPVRFGGWDIVYHRSVPYFQNLVILAGGPIGEVTGKLMIGLLFAGLCKHSAAMFFAGNLAWYPMRFYRSDEYYFLSLDYLSNPIMIYGGISAIILLIVIFSIQLEKKTLEKKQRRVYNM